MSDVAAVLRKARDLYAANPSHARPDIPVAHYEHCPYTAIMESCIGTTEMRLAALRLLSGVAGIRVADVSPPVASWNAKNSTETVLAAFDKAITEADNA
jgi:hypothetical protein